MPSEKPLGWHPPGDLHLRQLPGVLLSAAPGADLLRVAVLGLLAGVAARVVSRRRPRAGRGPRAAGITLTRMTAMMLIGYLLILVTARLVLDSNITFDVRHLQAALALIVVALAGAGASLSRDRRLRPLAVGALVVVELGLLVRTAVAVPGFSASEFRGYAAPRWTASPTVEFVRGLPSNRLIVTNAPDALWLHLGRTPLFLPLENNLYTGKPNTRYGEQLSMLARMIRQRQAVVVFFNRPTRGDTRRIPAAVTTALQLVVVADYSDGTVYRAAR